MCNVCDSDYLCGFFFLWILGTLYIPEVQCAHFLSTQFSNDVVANSSQLVTCCMELYTRYVVCMCVCVFSH